MTLYLACFDIADDKVRQRVGKLLGRYGDRVQKSVFEVVLADAGEMKRLQQQALDLLESGDDLRFYRLCADCRKASHDAHGDRIARVPVARLV